MIALIIALLYGWGRLQPSFNRSTFAVDELTAILAVSTMSIATIVYFIRNRTNFFWLSYVCFGVLFITIVCLLQSTGELESPFRVLFTILALCGGVFGIYAALPILSILIIYGAGLYIGESLTQSNIILLTLMGGLPLLTGYIIWRARRNPHSDGSVKQLESELSQIASKSDVVINAIADGVIALDKDGKIQLINPAAQRIIGWNRTDAMKLSYKSVISLLNMENKPLTQAADPIANVLATNQQIATNDLQIVTKAKKQLQVALDISPVGQLGSGVIIVFRDITKEKSDEREQTEFISTASHEMRTPVASIEGYLGLALNPSIATIDDKARDYIKKAHSSVEHLGRLFQDLLDVTKADDGRLSNIPKVVDVVEFLADIVQGMTPRAEQKGLRLFYKPRPDSGVILAGRRITPVFFVNVDNDHLREVVANLIENAIKYTPHGSVSVDVTGDNDHVVISIEDSGIGIPSEDIIHLFQKFYRVDNGETREIGGTGLGLYLCRRLCEAMGGRIWVESQYKQGSTFYVELRRISHEDAMRLIETTPKRYPQLTEAKLTTPPVNAPVTPALRPLTPKTESIDQQTILTPTVKTDIVAPSPVESKPQKTVTAEPEPFKATPPSPSKNPTVQRIVVPKRTFNYSKQYGTFKRPVNGRDTPPHNRP